MVPDRRTLQTMIPQIKQGDLTDLQQIATKIRNQIIETTKRNGGHLASSLGVVELTIALYRSFDFPEEDILVWDTGHQSYAHKIITGRADQFHTLRTLGGISGFTSILESPFDTFGAGHVGTAIGAGLGFEQAKRHSNQTGNIVAVVGDGALTSGPSLEALNLASQLKSNLRLIINDNGMSIHENVGAFARSFALLRTSSGYAGMKDRLKTFFKHTHLDGIETGLEKIRDACKHTILPQSFFENMGWKYIGPVDGHDLEFMIALLDNLKKDYLRPTIVHVHTCKGKGYTEAEKQPVLFHGIGKIDPHLSEASSAKKTAYSSAMGQAICYWARKDPRLITITAAMEEGTGLGLFKREFPDRMYDLGITESLCAIFSAALAQKSFHPVFAVYSTFLQRAYDQLVHDIALQSLPVLFFVDRAGIVGEDGPTHHGIFDISFSLPIPGSRIYTPSSIVNLVRIMGHLHSKGWHRGGPLFVRYPREEEPLPCLPFETYFEDPKNPEQWDVYPAKKQDDQEAVIFAVGSMFSVARVVQNAFSDHVTVVDCSSVKPLDWDAISHILTPPNPQRIFILEEGARICGFGQYLTAELIETKPDLAQKIVSIHHFAIPDQFIPHGSRSQLLDFVGLSAEKLIQNISEVMGKEPKPSLTPIHPNGGKLAYEQHPCKTPFS